MLLCCVLLSARARGLSKHNGVSIQICRHYWRRGQGKKRKKKTESVFRFRFFGATEKTDFRLSVHNPDCNHIRKQHSTLLILTSEKQQAFTVLKMFLSLAGWTACIPAYLVSFAWYLLVCTFVCTNRCRKRLEAWARTIPRGSRREGHGDSMNSSRDKNGRHAP